MSLYLYGFVEEKDKNLGIAPVTGPADRERLESLSKEKLVQALLQYQQKLEAIMRTRFILPCKFGTLLEDEAEAQQVVAQNGSLLKQWLSGMKNRCEMEIIATWRPEEILQEIAQTDPEMVRLKMEFAKLSSEEIGIRLSSKLKEAATCRAKRILDRLKEVSTTYALHPLMNDAMVFNTSFLVVRGEEEAVFKALEDLDKTFEGKLNFKCVGPLPPFSFATVTTKRFDREQIKKAQQTLGLNDDENLKAVQKAYKAKARQCHPDTHPDFDPRKFETIHRAYKVLADFYQGGAKWVQLSLASGSEEII